VNTLAITLYCLMLCLLVLPLLLLCPAAVAVGIAVGAALRLVQQATLEQKVRDWLHCRIGLIV
jgi:hypothetical protein